MRLDKRSFNVVYAALNDAFPTFDDLALLCAQCFDWSLADITEPTGKRIAILRLINRCAAVDQIEDFIACLQHTSEGKDNRLVAALRFDDLTTVPAAEPSDRSVMEDIRRSLSAVTAPKGPSQGPVGKLVERQVGRLQARAVELIDEGAPDRALDELDEGLTLVAALREEAPGDLSLRLQLGFIYKTMAQTFKALGDDEGERDYIVSAEEIFRRVADDPALDKKTALELCNAIHGLGNVAHARQDYHGAIENYRRATDICPDHVYAWHDMFLCYYELCKQGELNIEQMRRALGQVKSTDPSAPGLGRAHIVRLDAMLRSCEDRDS